MYNYLIYQNNESVKTLSQLLEDLQKYFANKQSSPDDFQFENEKIILSYGDYKFYIYENTENYITEELNELNENFEGKDFAGLDITIDKFSNSKSRFELNGEDDFDMDYFNESLFIIEFFERDGKFLIFAVN